MPSASGTGPCLRTKPALHIYSLQNQMRRISVPPGLEASEGRSTGMRKKELRDRDALQFFSERRVQSRAQIIICRSCLGLDSLTLALRLLLWIRRRNQDLVLFLGVLLL